MPGLTDPTPAMRSFDEALRAGGLPLQRCELDPDLYVVLDEVNNMLRFTYMRVADGRISAFVMAALVLPGREPTFQIGVAVPESLRRQGRAKRTVDAALKELRFGLARNGIAVFHVEAVIGLDNIASQRLAASTLSSCPQRIIDSVSGLPALHYVRSFAPAEAEASG